MDDLHFLRPEWLLVLPAWLALVAWVRKSAALGSDWDRVCDPALAPYVIEGGAAKHSKVFLLLAGLAGVMAIVALAGPAWRQLPQPVFRGQAALVIALDVSRSMQAADVEPSRLARARLKIRDILDRRTDGQTALVAYAGDAFTVTPLTEDTRTITALLPTLEPDIMPSPGSRADRAVLRGLTLLRQARTPQGQVLLVTDSAAGPELDQAVDRLVDAGYSLSILAVGTLGGAPIPEGDGFVKDQAGNLVLASVDETSLKLLAERGGGAYALHRPDRTDLEPVLPARATGAVAAPGRLKTERWREEGPWLPVVLAALVLPLFRRGRLD